MRILHLTLKKKWFDMIASGEKKEEYREIKPYWQRRFHSCNANATYSKFYGNCQQVIKNKVVNSFPCHYCEMSEDIKFDAIQFKNGYSKDAPTMLVEFKGIDIGAAVPEWSDNWQGDVFRIKIGKILTHKELSITI